MSLIPSIYCDKKQVNVNEEVTVKAVIPGGVWSFFPEGIEDDIYIISTSPTEDKITFKVRNPYESITVKNTVLVNDLKNTVNWDDSNIDGVPDYWNVGYSPNQQNEIRIGDNFIGHSMRVSPLDMRSTLTQKYDSIFGDEYTVSFNYRAKSDFELKVAGVNVSIPKTNEGGGYPVFPIYHGDGLVEFSITGTAQQQFAIFKDLDGIIGRHSYSSNRSAGVVFVEMIPEEPLSFEGLSIDSLNTKRNYIGELSDFPEKCFSIRLLDTNVRGDLSELESFDTNRVTNKLIITNAKGVTGNIYNIPHIEDEIDLRGCSNVTGSIGVLRDTKRITLNGCKVYGIIGANQTATYWDLDDTKLTQLDLEQSLINLRNSVRNDTALRNGVFICKVNMPSVNDTSACQAIYDLEDMGWIITVNRTCGERTVQRCVPSIIDMTQDQADSKLRQNGFVMGGITHSYSDTIPSGIIISYSREGYCETVEESRPPTSVDVVISKGPEQVIVPNLIGLNYDPQGIAKAEREGFELQQTAYRWYNTSLPYGKIFAQTPEANSMVNFNNKVFTAIYISVGTNTDQAIDPEDCDGAGCSAIDPYTGDRVCRNC